MLWLLAVYMEVTLSDSFSGSSFTSFDLNKGLKKVYASASPVKRQLIAFPSSYLSDNKAGSLSVHQFILAQGATLAMKMRGQI